MDLPLTITVLFAKLWNMRVKDSVIRMQKVLLKLALQAILKEGTILLDKAPKTAHCINDRTYAATSVRRNILRHALRDTLSGLSLRLNEKTRTISTQCLRWLRNDISHFEELDDICNQVGVIHTNLHAVVMICTAVKVVEEQKGAEARTSAEQLLALRSFSVPATLMAKLIALAPDFRSASSEAIVVHADDDDDERQHKRRRLSSKAPAKPQ